MRTPSKSFYRFAVGLLVYTLIVILWGAWVRISHSGDGCGASWPLCNGEVIPQAIQTSQDSQGKTWVEFSHRLTSGLFGLLVIATVWWGRKVFPAGHIARKAIYASLFFTVTEALLGAKLVLSGLVGQDDSVYRLVVMSLHQLNSLLLTGSVALTALFSSASFELFSRQRLENGASLITNARMSLTKSRGFSLIGLFIVIAVTGGFAALSTTLFPSSSLLQGITQDLAADAHYLLRLRISHPLLASLIGAGLTWFFWWRSQQETVPALQKATLQVALTLLVGIVFGFLTLLSLAPVWMKIVHLLLAHLMWIVLLRWTVLELLRRSARWIQSDDARSESSR